DIERGQPKLKNIVDLVRMLEALDASLDWQRFFIARQQDGTLRPTVNLLHLILDAACAQKDFPTLRAALRRQEHCRVSTRFVRDAQVFAPARYALRNKLWCARLYETSPAASLLWWATSLPFRTAVHYRPR